MTRLADDSFRNPDPVIDLNHARLIGQALAIAATMSTTDHCPHVDNQRTMTPSDATEGPAQARPLPGQLPRPGPRHPPNRQQRPAHTMLALRRPRPPRRPMVGRPPQRQSDRRPPGPRTPIVQRRRRCRHPRTQTLERKAPATNRTHMVKAGDPVVLGTVRPNVPPSVRMCVRKVAGGCW
jgi:hypothetical protein